MRLFGSVSTLYTCVICCEPRVFAGSRELKVSVFGGGWKGAVPAGGIAVLFIRTAGPSGSGRVALDAASIRLTARCGATERRWTVLERQGSRTSLDGRVVGRVVVLVPVPDGPHGRARL